MTIKEINSISFDNGQNIYKFKDENFLPSGVIINVKADGTGDFTKLSDVVAYLTGKWSSGHIFIYVYGAVTESATVQFNSRLYNIPYIWLSGQSGHSITFTNTGSGLYFQQGGIYHLTNLNIINSTGTTSTDRAGIDVFACTDVIANNVTLSGCCLRTTLNGRISLPNNVTVNNSKYALYARDGLISSLRGIKFTSNCPTLLYAEEGGSIKILNNCTKDFTGTTISNIANGTVNENGYIRYPSNW